MFHVHIRKGAEGFWKRRIITFYEYLAGALQNPVIVTTTKKAGLLGVSTFESRRG
jgi:hypothetical protein